uniref:Uncharacterized protein n=1 Tax=Ditylenchus dipsaci TaxID=166011 RepID=A0A915DIJ2_9BILA
MGPVLEVAPVRHRQLTAPHWCRELVPLPTPHSLLLHIGYNNRPAQIVDEEIEEEPAAEQEMDEEEEEEGLWRTSKNLTY